jgi:hypothetical protein
MVAVVGCGGGGEAKTEAGETQVVRGAGFTVSAPAGWHLVQTPRGATLSPEPGADTLVSITRFRLVRPFEPALWPRARAELDRVADGLAGQLGGRVESRETLRTGVRQYRLAYERKGTKLKQLITFVLRARREYELLCRWNASDDEPAVCGRFVERFRPSD